MPHVLFRKGTAIQCGSNIDEGIEVNLRTEDSEARLDPTRETAEDFSGKLNEITLVTPGGEETHYKCEEDVDFTGEDDQINIEGVVLDDKTKDPMLHLNSEGTGQSSDFKMVGE